MKAAIAQVFKARRQRRRVHATRSALGDVPKASASKIRRHVADRLRQRMIALMSFPEAHWPKLHATSPIERLNMEVERRADVVGIFPDAGSIKRLVGAILLEQNDEWRLRHNSLTLETTASRADAKPATLTQIAA